MLRSADGLKYMEFLSLHKNGHSLDNVAPTPNLTEYVLDAAGPGTMGFEMF